MSRGLLTGMALAVVVAAAGRFLADWTGTALMGFEKSPVSGVLLAIALGLLVANVAPALSQRGVAGLRFSMTTLLRAGIVLLGLRLSLAAASSLGLQALPVAAACILVALAFVALVGRALELSRPLVALIAVGTSICGVTAIVATAPLVRAREVEVSYATACVSLFGMTALLVYPSVAAFLFADLPRLAGMFLGTAIHDTAQVAGAALFYEEQFRADGALEAATVTKLVRNLCMMFVIPAIAFAHRRSTRDEEPATRGGGRAPLVPLFVVGFVACSALRTIGDLGTQPFGLFSVESWRALLAHAQYASEWALTIAMAAVGLGTRVAAFRALGWRPLALGLVAMSVVGAASAAIIFFSFS